MGNESDTGSSPNDAQFAAALRDGLVLAGAVDGLTRRSEPDALLDRLVRLAGRAIPVPEGALLLVDPARQVLTFEIVLGATADRVKDLVVPLGKGIAGLVAVSGQPLAIANAHQDRRHARDIAEQSGYLPTTILAVPVTAADGTVAGVLELLDREEQPTFSLADMELLSRFAEAISLELQARRADDLRAYLLGQTLRTLGGLPESAEDALAERLKVVIARLRGDPVARRTAALAELIGAVAARGEAEQQVCFEMLQAFAGYLEAQPLSGFGLDQQW